MKMFTLFIFSFLSISLHGQDYSKSWIDIDYASDKMNYHRLDVYLPEVEKTVYPVVILIYGSAWFGNDLKGNGLETIGKALLNNGYAVVTPNHRSSKDALFPAQIHDIKATIRFIRANATEYQLDTSFVAITGSSSGGHLSALAGTSGWVKHFNINSIGVDIEGQVGEYISYQSNVDAVVDWFGPTNLLIMDSCGSEMVHDAPDSPESCLIGGPIQDNIDMCALANPITYIDPTDPPFLIFHGDADPLVPHCQSEMLHEALQKNNVQSYFTLVSDAGHGPGVHEEKYFKMMVDFLNIELEKN